MIGKIINRWWRSVDQQLIVALIILLGCSCMLVTTASPAVATRIGLDEYYFSSRHMIYLLLTTIVIIGFSLLETTLLKRVALVAFVVNILLLILVKYFGQEVKGSTRWMSIMGISLQPSEFIKPLFAIVAAWVLSLPNSTKIQTFPVCIFLYFLISLLLITQPDFGMWIMVTATLGIQLFVAGMPLMWVMLIIIFTICSSAAAYLLLPHVADRINSFLDPAASQNYQISKSIMAFEHGGIYGRGPGEGVIKKILPDSHTDFIFAVAGEEFGAVVCLMIIMVFAFIVLRSLLKLSNIQDRFVQLAGVGVISGFALQTIINIGVTLNLFPTKGMTLPFISYGGSATLGAGLGIGALLSFTRQRVQVKPYKVQINV